MISKPGSLSRSSVDPSPRVGGVTSWQPQRAVCPAEVVDRPDQPHPALQRSLLTSRRTSPAHQRSKPRAQGGLKSLDIRGVDHGVFTSLRRVQPSPHRLLRANDDAPNHPGHSSTSVSLDRLGDHQTLWQKEPRTSSLPCAKRFAQHAQRLVGVAGKPIGAKQQALERPTSTYAFEEPPDQGTVAPQLHYSAQPKAATNRDRRGQPHYAADDADTQLISLRTWAKSTPPAWRRCSWTRWQCHPLSLCQRATVRSS